MTDPRHRAAIAQPTVVLILPDADAQRSIDVLRARRRSSNGDDWVRDGHDYLDEWVRSEQHRALADVIVHAEERTPEAYATVIADSIRDEIRRRARR